MPLPPASANGFTITGNGNGIASATEAAPDNQSGWRWLAAGYALLDQFEDAQATVQQLLRVVPRYNLRLIESAVVGLQPADLERLIDNPRKAGLPE